MRMSSVVWNMVLFYRVLSGTRIGRGARGRGLLGDLVVDFTAQQRLAALLRRNSARITLFAGLNRYGQSILLRRQRTRCEGRIRAGRIVELIEVQNESAGVR